MIQSIQDGGTLEYLPNFLPELEADVLFESLVVDTPWENHGAPRLTAWVGDFDYSYSGVTHLAAAWPAALNSLRQRVEAHVAVSFRGVLLNLYRDGNDSVGMHADNEESILEDSPIASISLGAPREFVLAYKGAARPRPKRIKMNLEHGSLLVMGGTIQKHWLHGIPKTSVPTNSRINLTFRQYKIGADLLQKIQTNEPRNDYSK
jgi:alkylated DNA repair dioxygenase AlkB